MQPCFETLAGATVDVRATPFDSFSALDPVLKNYVDSTNADRLNAKVRGMYGSDAFFLPIGKLSLSGGLFNTLQYLGIDTEDESQYCTVDFVDGMCFTLHAIAAWPGYYAVLRTVNYDTDLFVFKLVK